jgi:serine/threonine-protein kinase HipA
MEDVAGRAVLLLRRFAFLSAMSLLDAEDNEQRSYLEIADALRRYGTKPEEDCAQLWRRTVWRCPELC